MNSIWGEAINLVLIKLQDLFFNVIQKIPALIIALIILSVGWFIASLLRYIVLKIVSKVKIREKINRINAFQSLSWEDDRLTEFMGKLAYWSVIFLTLILVIEVVGINLGQLIIEKSLKIIPNIVVAGIVFIFGLLVSLLAEEIASIFMLNAKVEHRLIWAKIVKWITLIFAVIISLEQLGIVVQFVLNILLLITGASALALALAFGLGCKDIARDALIEFFKNDPKKS